MRCSPLLKADVVIVGGGAAGLMAAGTAAERGRRVVLVEPNDKLGRKLRITGKGRCNVTNACTLREFLENVPTNPKFLYSSMTAFPPSAVMELLESLGVPLKTERGRRVFPQSDKAADVAEALAAWGRRNGVKWLHGRVKDILTDESGVTGVVTTQGDIACASVILATGGLSYTGTGSTGDGHKMAARLGHTIVPGRASLVPLESPAGFCRELSGLSLRNVTLTVLAGDRAIYQELGEMLFAHFGVTGPLVLSASAHMTDWERQTYRLRIDLKPALDEEKLDDRILRDFEKYRNRDFANALDSLAPKSLAPVLVRLSGIPADTKVNSITREQRRRLVGLFKGLEIPISRPRPINEAIVTAGGVSVKEINPRTMESKRVPGLFIAGELLDVDAYTGGYNLQIAWATGRCAGQSATTQGERA